MAKYTLPTATENILGGVKIGNGIDVTQDGVISIHDYDNMKENISELEDSVKQGKALVASAITDKNVPTEADATFQKMASNIRSIKTEDIFGKINKFTWNIYNSFTRRIEVKNFTKGV